MRYRLVADLKGELFGGETAFAAERDGYLFELLPLADGMISKVAVSMKVPLEKEQALASSIEPGEGQVKASIRIGGDEKLHGMLVGQLQMLESELAVASRGAVWSISWDNPSKEFLPESSEEEELLPVRGASYAREYPPARASISSREFQALVAAVPTQYSLQVAKAFWREGMNAFRTFQYIQAFYWFFFIIEDFFAAGKTRELAFVKQLTKSEEFRDIGDYSLRMVREEPRHLESIDGFFQNESLRPTVKDLPRLLFRVRGRLHHYTSGSTKSQPTPFNQGEFESMALLTMHIASTSVVR